MGIKSAFRALFETEKRAVDVNNDLRGQDYNGLSFLTLDQVGSIAINEKTALKLSTVWACVRIKSNQLATLPASFYVRDSKGDSVKANNAAQRVINNPNAFMSSFDWKFAMIAAKMLHGNGYSRIIRNSNNEPTQLIPIHPDRVEVKIKNGEPVYLIDNTVPVGHLDMLHFKGLSLDGLVGISSIKAEAENLGLALASQNELKQFYGKGSKISGFVSYPNKLESGAKEKSEQALKNKISGTDPSSKVPIFDNGAKYVPVGVNPSEALWLDMMGYGVEEICRIFGVPPHLVASLKQSTNNNIEHQGMDFVNHGLMPDAKGFEEEVNRKLLSTFEQPNTYFKFNMNGLLRGDSAARAALYRALFSAGAINPNEIRRLEEMNGYEGGETYFIQLNQIDITKSTEYYMTEKTPEPQARELDEIEKLIEESKRLNK